MFYVESHANALVLYVKETTITSTD